MSRCYCLRRLKFSSGSDSSLKLKHLSIHDSYNLREVDIRDLKYLTSFEFSGDKLREIMCNGIAPITRVYYESKFPNGSGFEYALKHGKLASDFPQLETLFLYLHPVKEKNIPVNLPIFTNLKHLVLVLYTPAPRETLSLSEPTISFLKASPLLEKLELHLPGFVYLKFSIESTKLWIEKRQRKITRGNWKHSNLKEVVIWNFQGNEREMELIHCLVNHIATLEQIEQFRSIEEMVRGTRIGA